MNTTYQRVIVWGSFLALSTILLLTPLAAQAAQKPSSTHLPLRNAVANELPAQGSIYAIKVAGTAHIPGKNIIKPVSADMEFKVVRAKSTGIPSAYLELTSGKFSLGDHVYVLSKGVTTLQVNKLNIKASTEDGIKTLTLLATLAEPLPVSTTEGPVDLAPAIHHKSADIRVGVEDWVLNFGGSISRIS